MAAALGPIVDKSTYIHMALVPTQPVPGCSRVTDVAGHRRRARKAEDGEIGQVGLQVPSGGWFAMARPDTDPTGPSRHRPGPPRVTGAAGTTSTSTSGTNPQQERAKEIRKSPWQLGVVSGSLLSAKTIYRLADKGSNHLHDSSTNRLGGFSAAPRRATPGRPGSSESVSTVKGGPVPPISKPELNL
jgi:hypothetical protein